MYESAIVTIGYMALMNTIIETFPLLTASRYRNAPVIPQIPPNINPHATVAHQPALEVGIGSNDSFYFIDRRGFFSAQHTCLLSYFGDETRQTILHLRTIVNESPLASTN